MCFTYKAEIFPTIKYKGPCKEQYSEKGCNTVRASLEKIKRVCPCILPNYIQLTKIRELFFKMAAFHNQNDKKVPLL